jgi:hypothetical protein
VRRELWAVVLAADETTAWTRETWIAHPSVQVLLDRCLVGVGS